MREHESGLCFTVFWFVLFLFVSGGLFFLGGGGGRGERVDVGRERPGFMVSGGASESEQRGRVEKQSDVCDIFRVRVLVLLCFEWCLERRG